MTSQQNESRGLTAVLLIAHGSHRQTANDDLLRLADAVRERGAYGIVEVAYLAVAEPTIPQAARTCVQRGADRVLMFPYFLSAGDHAAGDLDGIRRELTDEFPDVSFVLCPPLGLHPLLIDVVFERLRQAEESMRGAERAE